MMKRGDQIAAVTATLAVLPATTHPLGLLATAAVATRFSHGRWSPDIDQYIDGIPHRGPTHTVEYVFPLAVAVAVLGYLVSYAWWVGAGIALGWTSHVVADGVFGGVPSVTATRRRRVYRSRRRTGRTATYRVRTRRVGFRFLTNGPGEHRVAKPLMIIACVVLVVVKFWLQMTPEEVFEFVRWGVAQLGNHV